MGWTTATSSCRCICKRLWLHDLEADRLRNLKAVSLTLSSRRTALVGRNGQGKTGLLEAVYLLSTGRSFRTRRNDDLVHWDGGPLRISGTVESRLGKETLGLIIDQGERGLLKLPADWLVRRRHNPFYDYLEQRVLEWVGKASR